MLKYLDVALLQAFTAVVDSGSFTRAALYLCRTQSAVSMQLRKLEELVGQQLLQRGSKRITLTPEGEVLMDYARRMIRLNEEALVALNQPMLKAMSDWACPMITPTIFCRKYSPDLPTPIRACNSKS